METDPKPDCAHEHHQTPEHPQVSDTVMDRAAGIFRAAGDPGRLRILHCLMHKEHCVSELSEELGWGMTTISQRLKVLRTEQLVTRRREGKHLYYRLADDHVAALIRSCLDHASHG